MKAWLNLCRWPNLCFLVLAHLLIRYSFLPAFGVETILNTSDFLVLSFSILCIAAAGNIINDIFDIKTDFVNRRQRPIARGLLCVSKAYFFYIFLNVVSVGLVFYLSFKYTQWYLLGVELCVILLLFFYTKSLKGIPVLGNILVSLLVSLSILLVVFADLNFSLKPEIWSWILFYAVFAFWTNLNREWIKDIMDMKGDYAQKKFTLPIILGKSRTNMLVFNSTVLLMFSLFLIVKVFFEVELKFLLYLTFGVGFPLVFILYKIWKNETAVNYKILSHTYKIIMLIGVCSLILFRI